MKKEILTRANQLDYAIWQLSSHIRCKSGEPKVLGTSGCGTEQAKIYEEVAKQLNQKVADYQYELIEAKLKELQKQFNEL